MPVHFFQSLSWGWHHPTILKTKGIQWKEKWGGEEIQTKAVIKQVPKPPQQSTLTDGLVCSCIARVLASQAEPLGSVPRTSHNWAWWHTVLFSLHSLEGQEDHKFIVILGYTVGLKLASGLERIMSQKDNTVSVVFREVKHVFRVFPSQVLGPGYNQSSS